jgi:hypothetical protein
MKKALLLLAATAFATASFAQTPETEVTTRPNGTKKIVTTTGKTNVGQALENTADAAGNVAKKGAAKVKHGFKKGEAKTKSASYKAGSKLKSKSAKMEAKSE